jgi:hypothetical protein
MRYIIQEKDDNYRSWSNVHGSGDNFDWVRGSGRTTSSGTGPSTDHTTNNSTGKTNIIL